MYENWIRRNPIQQVVDRHEGTPEAFVRRHQRECERATTQGPVAVAEVCRASAKRVADTRTLCVAWNHLACNGGDAPGPDGRTYSDYTTGESWAKIRQLSATLDRGTFTPGPERHVRIPKAAGDGIRTLKMQNIGDRVAQRATLEIVQPLLDPRFSGLSFGGRPGRGIADALAHADILSRRHNRYVWIAVDVRSAFDCVPLKRLEDVVRKRLRDEKLVQLILAQIANSTAKGLRQGAPLSPLLLNLYLDHFLDCPWARKHPRIPLLRYVDDILVLCSADDDVDGLYSDLAQLLTIAGLPPKGSRTDSIHDLTTNNNVTWLGFEARHGEFGLELRLPHAGGSASWSRRLRQTLDVVHEKQYSPLHRLRAVDGFIAAAGPAYPFSERRAIHSEIQQILAEFAFEEIPTLKEFLRRWRRAYRRWCELRMAVATATKRRQSRESATTDSTT